MRKSNALHDGFGRRFELILALLLAMSTLSFYGNPEDYQAENLLFHAEMPLSPDEGAIVDPNWDLILSDPKEIIVPLPEGVSLWVARKGSQFDSESRYLWWGSDPQGNSATISVVDGRLQGTVLHRINTYRLVLDGNAYSFTSLPTPGSYASCGSQELTKDLGGQCAVDCNDPAEFGLADESTVLDVINLYTPEAEAAALANGTTIRQIAFEYLAHAHLALLESAAFAQIREVAFLPTPGTISDSDPQGFGLADLEVDEGIRDLRDQYSADLVVVLRDSIIVQIDGDDHEICGQANILGRCDLSPQFATEAFSMVSSSERCVAVPLVYIHELGHNLGGRHEQKPDDTEEDGAFCDSFGYIDASASDPFVTVMVSGKALASDQACESCRIVARFSDSGAIEPVTGRSLGAPGDTEVIQTIRRTAPIVEKFRAENDHFPRASTLMGAFGIEEGSNYFATRESDEPFHVLPPGGGHSVWWVWVAPFSGTGVLDSSVSSFPSALTVYTGPTLDNLDLVSDQEPALDAVAFEITGNVTYFIAVDSAAGDTGDIDLAWDLTRGTSDVAVSLAAQPGVVAVGDTVAYFATIGNFGPQSGTDVTLTNVLGPELRLETAYILGGLFTDGCTEVGNTASCVIDVFPAIGGSLDIFIEATVLTTGVIGNTVTVSVEEIDPDVSNNSATVEIIGADGSSADLEVTLADLADPVGVGDNIRWLVNATNNGPETATNVVLTVSLPLNVAFVSASQPICSEVGGVVTCQIGNLASSESYIGIEITAQADETGMVSTEVEVSAQEPDPDSANNSATELTQVAGACAEFEIKLTATEEVRDAALGNAVAISGDTLVSGADFGEGVVAGSGAVFVFERDGQNWTQVQKLFADDGSFADIFGRSVAIDGDVIVVGASLDRLGSSSSTETGSAYVFARSGQSWFQQQKLIADDGAQNDNFGYAVAVEDETIVVTAHSDDVAAGSAYVFVWDGTTWLQEQKLVALDREAQDVFGFSVDIDAGTIVIGAPRDDERDTWAGAAYVFTPGGEGWVQAQKLFASDGGVEDGFGSAVDLNGNTLIVGGRDDNEFGAYSGAAYVFQKSGGWIEQQKLSPGDPGEGDHFGDRVSIAGDTIVVGAWHDDGAGPDSGSAYVFGWNGSSWVQERKLRACDAQGGDLFGIAVTDGDVIAVGAAGSDGAAIDSGAVYVYDADTGPSPTVTVTLPTVPATYTHGDSLTIDWSSTSSDPSDTMVLAMKRDDVLPTQTVPDGVDWYRFTESTVNDGSEDVTIPAEVAVADDWRFYVRHDASDAYDGTDFRSSVICVDSDGDGVCEADDACPGFDDNLDADGDGVPNACDICGGFDDHVDSDGDGAPDGCDSCSGCGFCSSTGTPASIHSTAEGGPWGDPDTWIEARVPGPEDHVQINGPVGVTGAKEVAALSISGNGVLDGGMGATSGDLTVMGNFVNNGTVGNPLAHFLFLLVLGDVINHGTLSSPAAINIHGCIANRGPWNINTGLSGIGPRALDLLVPLGGPVFIGGDVELVDSVEFVLLGISAATKLTINNGIVVTAGVLVGDGQLSGTGTLRVDGGEYNGNIQSDLVDLQFVNGATIHSGSLSSPLVAFSNGIFHFEDFVLSGNLSVLGQATLKNDSEVATLTINGDLTNDGTFSNTASSFHVLVEGDVTNDGVLTNSSFTVSGNVDNNATWDAPLTLFGNLVNNGVFSSAVTLKGDGIHTVDGPNPVGELKINGAVEIGADAQVQGALEIYGTRSLTVNAPRVIAAGGLEGGGELNGTGEVRISGGAHNGVYNGGISGNLAKLSFAGGLSFYSGALGLPTIFFEAGDFSFKDFTINGDVHILDQAVLHDWNDDCTLNITGNLFNIGVTENSRLSFVAGGDFVNDGTWNAKLTLFGNLTNNGAWDSSPAYAAWHPVAGASGYEFQLTENLALWPAAMAVSATTYEVTDLVDSIRFWRARGVTGGGPTEWSEPRSINAGSVELLSPNAPATYQIGSSVLLEWTSSDLDPSELMHLDMRRDSAPASQLEPDGVHWLRIVEATSNDASEEVVIPAVFSQVDDWRFYVRHAGTGVFDASDSVFTVECSDSDGDGVCDELDVCPGFDDGADVDGDAVPDDCDLCQGDDATGDSDGDSVCDDLDACPGHDDHADADADSIPDACDLCVGDNSTGDSDGNGICDDVQGALPGPSLVWLDGRRLMWQKRNLDGSLEPAAPYVIRGVNWSPASQSTTGDNAARRAEFGIWAATDAPLMAAMGVNTVRLYLDPGFDATALAVLDELFAHGIMAILTVDDAVNNVPRVQQAVAFFKDHPAVLMWMLGSEWNINLYFDNPACDTPQQAALCTEAAALEVKALDANHPVATSYGDIDIDADGMRLEDTAGYVEDDVPSVDVWSLNIFRGSTFGNLFDQWGSITGKPMFLGELGTDAMDNAKTLVDETMQAHWDLCLWHDLLGELAEEHPQLPGIGGLVFEWSDEWWK
ncbi:MAG: DUF11 domain-containing protein, partial [bacterium]|nr:DUF11 domain-containing protein [bacterium]